MFLNTEGEEGVSQSYTGRQLTLFGLMADQRWKSFGFPVIGEEGLMIGFRADAIHKVKVVLRGDRHTIVSW